MKRIPQSAKVFVGLVALGALLNLAHGAMRWESIDLIRFVCLAIITAAASRMKVSLPGLNGNMSVNLPFMLLAALELTLPQALIVAAASTAVQCLPKNGKRMTGIQILFNISTIINAVALAHFLAHTSFGLPTAPSKSLLLAAAAAGYFLLDTISVSIVISLSENVSVFSTWKEIFLLSFPYCALSAGMSAIVSTAMSFVAWYVPLALFPVMMLTYASFKKYFGASREFEVVSRPYTSSAAADD